MISTFSSFMSVFLTYPDDEFKSSLSKFDPEIVSLNSDLNPELREEVSSKVEEFVLWAQDVSQEELEMTYTEAFDLNMISYPYAGYHLFGESFKRGAFLAELIDRFKKYNFPYELKCIKELPDHVSVILKFLSHLEDEEEIKILIEDCLVPVFASMLKDFGYKNQVIPGIAAARNLLHSSPSDYGCASSCSTQGSNLGAPEYSFGTKRDYQKADSKQESDTKSYKPKGDHRNNPYAKLIKVALLVYEEFQSQLKGDKHYA